jgi:hypothetical protein
MRNKTNRSRISMVLAIALGFLVMTYSTQASAAAGSTVNVTVRNTSLLPQTATVSVQAVVNDTAVWSIQTVVMLPLQTRTVSVGFNGTVTTVLRVTSTCGLTDDGSPY